MLQHTSSDANRNNLSISFIPQTRSFCFFLADFRPLGPTGLADDVEADVTRAATSTTVRGAIPAMPNVDFLFRLLLGAPVRLLRGEALRAERGREFPFAEIELRERALVGTIPRAVPNDVRDVEAERTGVRLAFAVPLPRRVTDMERGGAVDERGKKFKTLRVKDRVDGRMTARDGDTGRDLRLVLKVAAVGKADRKIEPFGLEVEMLVVGVRVDSAEDRVLRFALAAIRTRLRANREYVTRARALLKARRMARDDRKRRFVYTSCLAVPQADVRLFKELTLVFRLEVREVLIHDFYASGKSRLLI